MRETLPSVAKRLLLALAVGGLLAWAVPAHAQTWRTATSARQMNGERRMDVALEYGAGRLTVGAADAGLLYRYEMRYEEEKMRPVSEYDRAAGTLRLGMEGRDTRGVRNPREGGHANVALSPSVAIDLDLDFGAGEADVNLGGLSLRDVQISTGASETRVSWDSPNRVEAAEVRFEAGAASLEVTGLGNARTRRVRLDGGVGSAVLDFSGAWARDADVEVGMGLGSVTLRIPRALGVRVTKSSFLASFDAPGMVKRGDAWYSRNYDEADRKLDVRIDAALGSVEIDWID
jgi:hypothetical protein